jgi:hypothetical protein
MEFPMKIVINPRNFVGWRVVRVTYDLIVLAFIFVIGVWACDFRNPLLMSIRDFEVPLYLITIALVWTMSRVCGLPLLRRSSSWVIPVFAICVVYTDYCYESTRQRILSDPSQQILELNRKFIVGYGDVDEVTKLSELKHFPGLARVHEDTHHFSAVLDDTIDELGRRDLIPFEKLAAATRSWIMLSHVTLAAVDSGHPVSTSYKVVHELLKEKLKIDNILITDDMTMGAIYHRGFCKSIWQSFESSVDYLLIAYDYEKYYDAIQCLEG